MSLLSYNAKQYIRKALPDPLRRSVRDILKKRVSKQREKAKKKVVFQYGRFGPEELYNKLRENQIKPDGVLLVQSSFDRFYNFDGTAEDVLNVLERIVGDRGTLMMPAHPRYNIKTPSFFDVRKTPTRTGLLCELFRRKSGVLRSLHPTHSVCARGPLAKMLVEEHHKDPLSCGLLSPYAKLVEFSGNILGLGLPPGYTTFLHVVEDLDVDAYPKRVYADKIFEFTIMDERGDKFTMKLKRRDNRMGARMDLPRFTKYLNEKGHRVFDVHGIPCFVARAKPLLDELKDLTKRGILLYR